MRAGDQATETIHTTKEASPMIITAALMGAAAGLVLHWLFPVRF
jgi:hypothetical protein